jgi:putative addiction module component (TIGR02574 family)
MAREPAEVLRDALTLPAEARVVLIESLIDSLDAKVDCSEDAWLTEIHRRLDEIDRGAVQLIAWKDARRRLRESIDR